jgi:hypothetical protein
LTDLLEILLEQFVTVFEMPMILFQRLVFLIGLLMILLRNC